MTRRDTLQCVHEPFGDAYYFGPERLAERYEDDEKARTESGYAHSTYKTIFDRIAKEGSEVGLIPLIIGFMPLTLASCLTRSTSVPSPFASTITRSQSRFLSLHLCPIRCVHHVCLSIHPHDQTTFGGFIAFDPSISIRQPKRAPRRRGRIRRHVSWQSMNLISHDHLIFPSRHTCI
jgi:hypothetical protein